MTAQMVLDGDPDKVNVSGYTKGDVLAANTAGTLTAVPVGTNTEVLTADSSDAEGVDWAPSSGSGGTPSNTVVTETSFGQGSTAGVSTDFSRGDHTHGTPAAPSVPTAGGTVVTETSFGQASTAGAAATWSRSDHTHGTPAAPTAASVGADPAGAAAAAQAASQPLDADLTTIAGLTPTTGNVIQSVAGAWASQTPAQVKTSLTLVKGDVGLGNVDNTSDANKPVSTAQAAAIAAITPRVRQAYITTGNVTPPNTGGAWAALTGFELAIPAAVGEYVEIQAEFLNEPKPSTFLDYAVIVGTTLVRFGATSTATPGIEGLPGFYPDLASFKNMPGPVGFTVTSGDLDGGNVRWVLASASTTGVGTVFASAAFPFFWRTVNRRTVL